MASLLPRHRWRSPCVGTTASHKHGWRPLADPPPAARPSRQCLHKRFRHQRAAHFAGCAAPLLDGRLSPPPPPLPPTACSCRPTRCAPPSCCTPRPGRPGTPTQVGGACRRGCVVGCCQSRSMRRAGHRAPAAAPAAHGPASPPTRPCPRPPGMRGARASDHVGPGELRAHHLRAARQPGAAGGVPACAAGSGAGCAR